VSVRCVFLDRDGVINEKPAPHQYILSTGEFRLLPNIADWIRLFNTLDFVVIVITNQRGVARGLISEATLASIHSHMVAELAARGAHIHDIFYCPHEENSCDCRKPKPGLVYAARDKWDIDLAHSLMLGDSDSDQQLAAACGVRFLRVRDGRLA
jgi:D-glycero-D-manno-heptose 1,7-bisphosphate phosphatase